MATVAPNFHNINNPGAFSKRKRNSPGGLRKREPLDVNYSNLYRIADRTKRQKIETTPEIPKQVRFADEEKSRSSGMRSGYVHKFLGLSDDETYRNEYTRELLHRKKKLHLVLDLDHTLLNTTFLDEMSPDEEYLKTQTQADHSLHIVDTPNMKSMTKLRPYILTFLVQADLMFDMSIYTMGGREYALEMVKLLDPKNIFFGGRVISRNDSTYADQKALDVRHARESAVVILDDTKDVWKNDNQDNVIVMPRYHFFKSSCEQYGISNSKPYSELKTDEHDWYQRYGKRSYLQNILERLRQVHTYFFSKDKLQGRDLTDRDVRLVLKILQKGVLKGCKIVFSHIFRSDVKAETHPLWKMAEQLGATCSTKVDPSVTHVVAADAGTEKSKWAVKEGKLLVNPHWIHTAQLYWERQPEHDFPVNTNVNQLVT